MRISDWSSDVCSSDLRAAFEVDPVLAGEMIFRATDEVWAPIGTEMRSLAEQWHAPGKVDRAVRFMIASGRPEFADLLWPLISHANTQVHLPALRAAKRFRPSRSEEHTSELQSLMRISYAVFCLKKK